MSNSAQACSLLHAAAAQNRREKALLLSKVASSEAGEPDYLA
jgi:hypothetical protein